MTEYGLDSWCFGAKGTIGFIIMCVALSMDKSLEKDPTELINCSLVARTKSNMRDVWKGVKLPELWKAILYFAIMGIFVPSFSTFLYYYQIAVTGFTQI
jgi:hypothetical protein